MNHMSGQITQRLRLHPPNSKSFHYMNSYKLNCKDIRVSHGLILRNLLWVSAPLISGPYNARLHLYNSYTFCFNCKKKQVRYLILMMMEYFTM